MYQLIVKPYGTATFLEVDLGDETPAMNYNINDIADLKDKFNDFSPRLRLPKTPKNCRVFGHMQCHQINSKTPYRRHDCRLFRNGVAIAGKGSKIILYDTTEFFEVGISSGNYDFFKQLQDINFTADEYKDILGVATRSFQTIATGDNFFSLNCYAGGGVRTDTLFNGVRVYDYPFTYFQGCINKLLAHTGYTMVSDVNMNDESDNVHTNYKSLSLVDRKAYDTEVVYKLQEYENFIHYFYNNQIELNSYQFPFVTNECHIGVRVTVEVDSVNKGFDGLYLKYNSANWLVSVNRLLDDPSDGSWAELEGGHLKKSVDIFSNGTIMSSAGEQASFTKPYDVVPLDANVTFGFYTQYEGCNSVKIEFIIKPNTTYAIPGQKMSIAANLGISNAKELFKLYTQIYGLTVDVDNNNKTVYAYLLTHIYDNKPNADDWTLKLYEPSIDESYVMEGYAQRNKILLKENKKNGLQDSVVFKVDNHCLVAEKEMFTLELETGLRNIITWHVLSEDGQIDFRKLDAPHLLNLDTLYDQNPELWVITHANIQSLFDYGYKGLKKMLDDTKVIEADFSITELDIINLNRYVPKYLKQYGAFFYLNSISNFGAKGLTKCKLVKM